MLAWCFIFLCFYLFILFVDMAVARAMLTWCFILFILFFYLIFYSFIDMAGTRGKMLK
jgi:hypothetical protein